ncbi:hypothetical protein EON67_11190 [archaeon]|nr:MAG: hypothetical protein EON67_11190 [archaeon]
MGRRGLPASPITCRLTCLPLARCMRRVTMRCSRVNTTRTACQPCRARTSCRVLETFVIAFDIRCGLCVIPISNLTL